MNKQVIVNFSSRFSTRRKFLSGLFLALVLPFLLNACGFATPTVTPQTPLIITTAPAVSSTPAPAYSTPTPLNPGATPVPTAPPELAVINKYKTLLPGILKENNIPGLAIALVDDTQVLWSDGFGYTDLDHKTKIDARTIFSMQSISKNFTSIAVLIAAQEGLVNLDTPISNYLPGFHFNSIFEAYPEQKITLKHLLSHTAGFTHEAPIGSNNDNTPASFEDHIKSISQTWLKFPVGQGYSYSNLGIDLAGYILQVRSGKPFEQYMQEKVLEPVGMLDSSFDMRQIAQVTNRATGHDVATPQIPVKVPMLAAGGLYSNADDMAKYLQFFINQGVVRTAGGEPVRVVPESLLETIYAPPSMLTRQQGVGWGVFAGRKHNTYYIGSGGGGFGFLCDFIFYPELKIGLVTLTNSADHNLQGKLSGQILDEIINTPGSLYNRRMLELNGRNLAPWEEPGDLSFQKAADIPKLIQTLAPLPTAQDILRWNQYTGDYVMNKWGQPSLNIRIYVEGDHLFAVTQGTAIKLEEVRPGLFFVDNGEALDFTGPVTLAQGNRLIKQ
jgi:CubicO group peptidase (beta-lactamase class C family)